LHSQLYADLRKIEISRELLTPALGTTLLRYTPFLKLYTKYVNNYTDALNAMKSIRDRNANFDFFLTLNEKCEGARVEDWTILPVQRVPRYLLLLKGIMKCTEETDVMFETLNNALNQVSKVTDDINHSIKTKEAQNRVIEVQNHLVGDKITLVTPTRFHVRDGMLKKKKYNKLGRHFVNWKNLWWFMFNDCLLYTSIPNASGRCKPKYLLPFSQMDIIDLPNTDKDQYMFELTGASTKKITLQASSYEEKISWMDSLREYIDTEKKNLSSLKRVQPTT